MSKTNPRILVVGSINMDLVVELDRMPEGGETLFGNTYSYIPGGKGANQAVAAARLGADISFCGRVGDDANGKILLDNLRREGIDISHITTDKTEPTGLAVIPVDKNGQNRIIVISGANMAVSAEDVGEALKDGYDAVMAQLEVPLEVVFETLNIIKQRRIPFILDAGPAMQLPLEKLRGIDVISPNESEIFALTGINPDTYENAVSAAKKLAEGSGAKNVVVKLGERGALLYRGGEIEAFPAFPGVNAVDTTAAGDSFTAALTVQMIKSGDISGAIRYANAAGALCVSRKGAQPSLPTAREVERYLKVNS